jgi:hypothetical protein
VFVPYRFLESQTGKPAMPQYITVSIDNIESVILGTEIGSDRMLAILAPAYAVLNPTILNISQHIEYRNVLGNSKIYAATALRASLDRVNIAINHSSSSSSGSSSSGSSGGGSEMGEVGYGWCDRLDIERIYSDYNVPDVAGTIVIRVQKYFNGREFIAGDLLMISDYVFHNATNNECYQLNQFVNRKAGHRIVSIGKSGSAMLYDLVMIEPPQLYSRVTGELEYEDWYVDFLIKNNFSGLASDNSGRMLNMSVQMTVCMEVDEVL